ncbi:MAG: hypothetical protein EZS28_034843, partial [Streblomastix strix]
MNPKFKGRQPNRITTQFILMRAEILAVEQVNNWMNFKKIMWMSLNIQKFDHKTRTTRNTNTDNIRRVLDNRLGPLFSQMNYPGPPRRAPDQSYTKLRSTQPSCRKQWIDSLTYTNPQTQTTPYRNQNQSTILNVELMRIITNPFSVPKEIQHQQIAGEAVQVHHAPREIFSTNGNVRRVASSTDSIVSGQI